MMYSDEVYLISMSMDSKRYSKVRGINPLNSSYESCAGSTPIMVKVLPEPV
jgi:hypothetical protein